MSGTVVEQGDVFLVVFGDEVHLYPAEREQAARAVFMVGVAAYGDGDLHEISAQEWPAAREKLHRAGISIKTH